VAPRTLVGWGHKEALGRIADPLEATLLVCPAHRRVFVFPLADQKEGRA